MKEFVKKLIGRLKEELKLAEIDRERYLHGNSTQFNYGKAVGYGKAVSVAIEIVNQLAKEYNNDFCEWKYHRTIDDVPMYETSCYHEFEERFVKKYKFCPYCGKKIKVIN